MVLPIILTVMVISLAAAAFAGYLAYDAGKKEMLSRVGQLNSHLLALQGRLADAEKAMKTHKEEMAKVSLMVGQDLKNFEDRLGSVESDLSDKADIQAIDNMNNEFFSLKSATEALGQKFGKKRRPMKSIAKDIKKNRNRRA